ncbi:SOS3-interacting protein 1 [Hibiscus syriacus]|uniref:SOS3-interacting protein 1 n=1 Tax=Hibiscus syriacus TaxID=106335 RepID=A0A6A2ZB66_HIBSY|nr:SOS3-interacting protein 1 [Hibiscus syriacus]
MHDDFFPRRSRREVHIVNLSSDDQFEGAAAAAVPFNWESEPGTPKVKCREIPRLPPLTPPPSYFYSTPKRTVKHHSKPKLLDTFLPKRLRRKPRPQHSPVSSSPSSSASSSRSSSPWPRSYSVPSSPIGASNLYAGNELPRANLFSESSANKEDREYKYCAASTPCFGGGARAVSRGFCSTMFKALLRDK